MKIPSPQTPRWGIRLSRSTLHAPRSHSQDGIAVIVVLTLIAMLLLYVAGNLRSLDLLGRELKIIDRQQIRRLERSGAVRLQTTDYRPQDHDYRLQTTDYRQQDCRTSCAHNSTGRSPIIQYSTPSLRHSITPVFCKWTGLPRLKIR